MSTVSEFVDANCYHAAVVDYHRELVRDYMLGRIVCFGADDDFAILVKQLAEWLSIPQKEAANLLWPVAHGIYQAASTSEFPKLEKATNSTAEIRKSDKTATAQFAQVVPL